MSAAEDNGGIRISWAQIVSGIGALLLMAGVLVVQQARQEARISSLESGLAMTRSEMIGQRRFEDFSSANQREHSLMLQQMQSLQTKVDELARESRAR